MMSAQKGVRISDFLFAVPTGEPVALEPFHYAIIGQTQFSGKTTLIKRLSEWVTAQNYKVLIFDTKETEADYAGFGHEVPVCLRETTDSFVLIGLLESMFKRRLTQYYATLSRLTERVQGFSDIIKRAKELESKTKSSWLRDACRVLYDLLERLQSETSKFETVPQLKLYPGINCMPINDFSLEAQQLIIKNAFEDALRIYKRNLILVIDEAFKFLPQNYSSAATKAVLNVITQGAKTGLFTWIATQFLAVTDKDPLKACAVKFLGTQDHITEVKHTLDLIPEVRGKFSADDIMKLKLGHWILVRKRPMYVGIVYALPVNVPREVGIEVAKGVQTPEFVRDHFLKPMEVDDLVWKEKYEQLEKQFVDIRTKIFNELKKEFEDKFEKEIKDRVEEERQNVLREVAQKTEEYQQTITKLKSEKAALEAELKKLEPLKDLGEALAKFLRVGSPGFESGTPVPSEVVVQREVPALTVQVLRKQLILSTDNTQGRAALLYAEGFFDEGERTISAVQKEMMRRGWPKDPRLSGFLDELCSWGYLQKRRTDRWQYKAAMKSSDAHAKGLLKINEEVVLIEP